MNSIELAIDVLAATRLTRLITQDTFPPVKALRDRIVDAHTEKGQPVYRDVETDEELQAGDIVGYGPIQRPIGFRDVPDSWAELVTCPWCAGMWVCLGVVLARRTFPRAWAPLAKALASSMVVGLIESKIDVD